MSYTIKNNSDYSNIGRFFNKLGVKTNLKSSDLKSIFNSADLADGSKDGIASSEELAKAFADYTNKTFSDEDIENALNYANNFGQTVDEKGNSSVITYDKILNDADRLNDYNSDGVNYQKESYKDVQKVNLTGDEDIGQLNEDQRNDERLLRQANRSLENNKIIKNAEKEVKKAKKNYDETIKNLDEEAKNEIADLKAQKQDSDSVLKEQEKAVKDTDNKINKTETKITLKEGELSKLRNNEPNKNKEKFYTGTKSKGENNEDVYDIDEAALSAAQAEWEEKVAALEKEIEELKSQKEELKAQKETQETALNKTKEENAEIDKQIREKLSQMGDNESAQEAVEALDAYNEAKENLETIKEEEEEATKNAIQTLESNISTRQKLIDEKEEYNSKHPQFIDSNGNTILEVTMSDPDPKNGGFRWVENLNFMGNDELESLVDFDNTVYNRNGYNKSGSNKENKNANKNDYDLDLDNKIDLLG